MITEEIELKFIIQPEQWPILIEFFAQSAGQGECLLSNIYYDTADNLLRHNDIGLRIRGIDQHYEMTLKGPADKQSLAGLHQRAEYNCPLPEPKLDLTLLPPQALPDQWDIQQLQSQLLAVFSTNFKRKSWLLHIADSQIEIVADQGEVIAGEQQESINEIELELKHGQLHDLLQFANQLTQFNGLRLGSESKAARGYRLAGLTAEQQHRPLQILKTDNKLTVEQGMQYCLRYALDYWQYHEELSLRHPENLTAQQAIWQGLAIIRQTWSLFSGLIPRKATSRLREQQSKVEALWLASEDKNHVIYHHDYLSLKLALLQWLFEKQWLLFIKEEDKKKLSHSFKRFCDIKLSRVAANLKRSFASSLSLVEFKSKQASLQVALIDFYLLSAAYPQQAMTFIAEWQNLFQTNSITEINALRLQALQQPAYWLNGSNKKG